MSNVLAMILAFLTAVAPYVYHFPRDHFAHDAYRTEWWYFTGHLQARGGRRFGYELTFFRIALQPHAYRVAPGTSAWRAAQLYPAHFAITDERGHRFIYSETFARDALGQGLASENRFDVRANRWRLTGTNDVRPRMHLSAERGGNAIDLVVASRKPPAVHGRDGVSRKGACASCASHYYSFTRLDTRGTVTLDGARFAVAGASWMDHEYASGQLDAGQVGWDWFSLQLDDGREIMLYRLRERDGHTTPQSSGSVVDRNGRVRHVPLRAFTIAPLGTWTSPHTGARYPSGWRLHIEGIANDLVVTPLLDDQELVDATGTTYWEGAADVRDGAGRRLGAAYVELTGYVSPLRLK